MKQKTPDYNHQPSRRPYKRVAIVVGAGVIGLSVAISLQRRNWKVVVLDSHEPGWASPAAAGVLFPTSPQRSSGLAGHLNLQALELWPQWAGCLDGKLLRGGGISFFADSDTEKDFLALADNLESLPQLPRSDKNYPGWSYLGPETQERITASFHFPAAFSVDPQKLLEVLRRAVGAHFVSDRAEELLIAGSRAKGVVGRSGYRYLGDIIIAAPGSTPPNWLPSELRPKIMSMAGEALLLSTNTFRSSPAAIYPPATGLLASRRGEVWFGGSYRQEDSEQQLRLDILREMMSRGVEIFPDLAQARIKKVIYGRRPVTLDQLPIVGPSQLSGIYWAGGHGKDGILQSALIGNQLVSWLEKDIGQEELLPQRAALI